MLVKSNKTGRLLEMYAITVAWPGSRKPILKCCSFRTDEKFEVLEDKHCEEIKFRVISTKKHKTKLIKELLKRDLLVAFEN